MSSASVFGAREQGWTMGNHSETRMGRRGYRPPEDVAEPEQLVLLEFVLDERVAVITLNRPHADNAITTELALQFIEVLETIAARPSVRVNVYPRAELMDAVLVIADNYPPPCNPSKRAVRNGQGEPVEQAVAIMMDQHWRSVVHSDRFEGIKAHIEGRDPVFPDPDF
jgi:hypothetical protein